MAAPADIVASARPGNSVVGWKLERSQRDELLDRFAPKYESTVADHVTLKARVDPDTALPDTPTRAAIVGRGNDGRGVEAMVVAIEGTTNRAGGGTYHITWSLGPGRRAVESNDVLASGAWEEFDEPVPIELIPAHFR